MDKYLSQAQLLEKAGFFVTGIGNFDVSTDDVARILCILDDPLGEYGLEKGDALYALFSALSTLNLGRPE